MAFVLLLAFLLLLSAFWLKEVGENRRLLAMQTATPHAQSIAIRLNETMGAAYMLAGLVRQGRGDVVGFASQAASIADVFPLAKSLQLAPNGIIRYVYPETDVELLVGSDLLRSPARRAEAYQAVVKRQLVVGGPYAAVQGGVAVIGRLPIFLPKGDGWEDFWGFAIVLVSLPELLSSSRVADLVEHGYRFEICRLEEDGDCNVFSQRGSSGLIDPIELGVEVAQGRWLLRLEREDGWVSNLEKVLVALGCMFLAMLATAVFHRLTRAAE